MRRIHPLVLFAFALLSGLAVSRTSQACPFCSAPSLTLSEQLAASQAAVLVQWVGGEQANRKKGFDGTTQYEILQLVRDESQTLKKGGSLTLERYRAAQPGDLFLVLGSLIDDRIEWGSPLEVTETSFNYVVQAPSKESPPTERLAYFLRFLEYPDPEIATDAFSEFANAPYEDIVLVTDQMPREKVRKWLADPQTIPTRVGLYGLMLGLCGQAEDADFLKAKVLEDATTLRLGIDGLMAGYLVLTGTEGLQVISEAKLMEPKDPEVKVPFSETFAAMQALRFMWTYGNSRIPHEDLRQAMRILLDRPELTDLVIVDLARWQDWGVMDRLMSMYGESAYDVPSIKRAIVRFMLIAEKDAVTTGGSDVQPPHVVDAKKNLAALRKKDPKTVKDAERYFFD